MQEQLGHIRELDFFVETCTLKSAYGQTLALFENTNKLKVNTNREYYDSNLGILYIHAGSGKLQLELALKPLVHLKSALLHEDFINELDKALIGEPYDRKFRNAINEFIVINNFNFKDNTLHHCAFKETLNKLIAQIH